MTTEYLTVDHLSTKDLIRIFSRIKIDTAISFNNTPCWNWTGQISSRYGTLYWDKANTGIHRIMYAWLVEPVPTWADGQQDEIDHLCRNKRCCNPLHLELVPHRVNILRADSVVAQNARKTYCNRGHLLADDNLLVQYNGKDRACKACKYIASNQLRQKKRLENAEWAERERARDRDRWQKRKDALNAKRRSC